MENESSVSYPQWILTSTALGVVSGIIHDKTFRYLIFDSAFDKQLDIYRILFICLLRGLIPLIVIQGMTEFFTSSFKLPKWLELREVAEYYKSQSPHKKFNLIIITTFTIELFSAYMQSHGFYPGSTIPGILGPVVSRELIIERIDRSGADINGALVEIDKFRIRSYVIRD